MKRIMTCAIIWTAAICACGTERDPIDRVQPNYLDKSDLNGTWYYGKTVIDAPYGAGYTFVGEQGPLYKVDWVIQEHFLIARRSYAHVNGAEPNGIAGRSETGNAVAMYRIQKHFDIARDYSPITGEETNVLVENAYDRPWYDRQYFRVDWSINLVSDNELLIFGRVFHGIQFEPVSYFVPERAEPEIPHPHAPKFERHTENDELYYMDVVNKVFVRPSTSYFEGFGEVPDCYLSYNSTQDCASNDLSVRNSFLKVDEKRDYEPAIYTGDRMRRFGYFVTDRPGYTEHYGPVDAARMRLINRHNIWEQSHQHDTEGQFLRCTAENADTVCGGRGAKCDLAWARAYEQWTPEGQAWGACTIPYQQRTVKPIAYHLSPDFPDALEQEAQAVSAQWNTAFSKTVSSLREIECLANQENAQSCANARSQGDEDQVFVLCHNPVVEKDHAACGSKGTQAQLGDLRYSLLGWVTEPNSFSPLGYGPSMADPQTGELINGTALIYGAALEHVASFSRDVLALLSGDLDEAEIMLGLNVKEWVERQVGPAARASGRTADQHRVPLDGHDAKRLNQALDFSWHPASQTSAAAFKNKRPKSLREFRQQSSQSLHFLSRAGVLGGAGKNTTLRQLANTDIEELMTGIEMRLAAGVPPGPIASEAVLDAASPLRGLSSAKLREHQNATTLIQKHACILNANYTDEGMLGLAKAIRRSVDDGKKNFEWGGASYVVTDDRGRLDYDQVRQMLRHVVLSSVASHELGHTLGLRHNFSGSFDSLNYHPNYWKLRNDGDMRPRAWDPLTEEETQQRIREYQYSTVMDYGNNFVASDTHGLGHYDVAAIKMGYGDLVEVFSDAPDPGTINLIHAFYRGDWPVALKVESFTGGEISAYQYTDLPEILGGLEGLNKRADVPYASLETDPFLLENAAITDKLQDPLGRATVPYRFCSDEEVGLRPECQQFDAGADVYESIQSIIDTYWNQNIFDAFRRGRVGFRTEWHSEKLYERYFSRLHNLNQIYVLFRSILTDVFGPTELEEFWSRSDGMGAWTTAVGAAFQLLTQVVSTPQPGYYELATRNDGSEAMTLFSVDPTTIDSFEGRYLESTWDFDAGYYWFDQLASVGFYYDKVAALQILTDPDGYFLGRDTATDVREYQINFYTSFGPSLTSFLRGLLAEDWQTVGPRITETGTLKYPDPLSLIERDLVGTPVDPNASFSIQLFAAVFGMTQIPKTFSQSYFHSTRIFAKGGAESFEFPDTQTLVAFEDPFSGITYQALSYPDDQGKEAGVGASVLLHAQNLADRGAIQELSRYMDNVNLIRRLSWLLDLGQ